MSEKRKFSSKRLYKLAKWSVIVISILATLYAALNFYSAYMDQTSCSNSDFSCLANGYRRSVPELYTAWGSVKIAILLPILFFGGAWVYKFLFPYKKS